VISFFTAVVRVIRSRNMRWEKHVARMGEKKILYKFLFGKTEEKMSL
jgi:hypothetical protein